MSASATFATAAIASQGEAALGYPTKNVLKSWHRQYEQAHDLPQGSMRARSRSIQTKQKKVAAQHYLEHDRCLAATLK